MIKKTLIMGAAFAVAGTLGAAAPAFAQVDILNFAGLNGAAYEAVDNYYNGGYGGNGSGPGTNYGITFSSNGIVCDGYPDCNSDQIPGGPGANALFFQSGASAIMDMAAGFTTGFSFYYSAPVYTGSVQVWSGLDGTGALLATINLPLTPAGGGTCLASYCPYVADGISFNGTAESVSFAGTENYIAFADITIGSSSAGGAVPEPSSLMLLGAGLVGFTGYRMRRRT
jgi:hypothetical protein